MKCDSCGVRIRTRDGALQHYTDAEVCGNGDGPGFLLCGRTACGATYSGLDVEARRALFTAGREAHQHGGRRAGAGRPAKAERRDVVVKVYVSAAEAERLEAAAGELTPGDYLAREAGLRRGRQSSPCPYRWRPWTADDPPVGSVVFGAWRDDDGTHLAAVRRFAETDPEPAVVRPQFWCPIPQIAWDLP